MADLCFIYNESLSQGDPVNVVRGLKTLRPASIERNDGYINFLNSSTSVNVHTECRKVYISKNYIAASKRCIENSEPLSPPIVPRKRRNEVFDFKKPCLFCDQVAEEAAETKKKEKYRDEVQDQ
ncbi:SWIM-type domain-containing protein [Trichonephila inaurata madagascariensis]|uniref:SWIM-type domain-containing protein n=1 Tax=Trichonephila inaurata madagascariensis TaxID=2747483 RepID=A0A8X6WLS3_9ARAC|nr:SWIM-type domain-containing protein [Trichonephila inaurata madagascariensis]